MDFNLDENYEKSYHETGEEQKLSILASNSRPHSDFFKQFIPSEYSKHRYSVCIHPAIYTKESFELFQKFDLA